MSKTYDQYIKHKKQRLDKYKDVKLKRRHQARLLKEIKNTFLCNKLVGLSELFEITYREETEQLLQSSNKLLERMKKL